MSNRAIYNYLKEMILARKNGHNPLFLLRILKACKFTIFKDSIFSDNEIRENSRLIFENYIQNKLVSGNYFLFACNLILNIRGDEFNREDLIKYLKEKFQENKELYKSFLHMTIYDIESKKKSLWTRLYDTYPDLVIEEIYPIFNNIDEFKSFVLSIESWDGEEFANKYKQFLDLYIVNSKNHIATEFDFKNLLNISGAG